MTNHRQVSVFDIIGPIMVGPSSSHTAGAVRLGLITRAVLGAPPEEALIEFHGSFAKTGQGHGTGLAVIAGLLGLPTDDDRIRRSFELAKEAGLSFRFETVDFGESAHPNTARLTVSAGNESISVIGSSVGGGSVEITEIQGYQVMIDGEYETLIVIVEDRPGRIHAISGCLAEHDINIALLHFGRNQRGGEAMMVVETDQVVPPPLVSAVLSLPGVRWVRHVAKVSQ